MVAHQASRKLQLDAEHLVAPVWQFPPGVPFWRPQNLRQLFTRYRDLGNLSNGELESSHMIGSQFNKYSNILSLTVRLGDHTLSIFPWVDMFLDLLMVRIATNATFSIVSSPLYIKTPAVKLVVGEMAGTLACKL